MNSKIRLKYPKTFLIVLMIALIPATLALSSMQIVLAQEIDTATPTQTDEIQIPNPIALPSATELPTVTETVTEPVIMTQPTFTPNTTDTETSTETATLPLMPTPLCGQAPGTGLRGDYYHWDSSGGTSYIKPTPGSLTSLGLDNSRIDSTVDFDWGVAAPYTGGTADHFAVRWSGKILFPVAGDYTIKMTSDDGNTLDVFGSKISNWMDSSLMETDSLPTYISEGCETTAVVVEYYETTGGAKAVLSWLPPWSSTYEVIPQIYLIPPAELLSTSTATTTPTITVTPTITMTRTITQTPTITMTRTITRTPTKTMTPTITTTRTVTWTPTTTSTVTKTPTITVTPTRTGTPTITLTRTSTNTSTITVTRTSTNTPTVTKTQIATKTLDPAINRIYYVKPAAVGMGNCTSWRDACLLQDALARTISGDQIWVTAGTYKPTTSTDRSATFQLKDGVAVYGGFAGMETELQQRDIATNLAILSGDLNGDDSGFTNNTENIYHVVTGVTGATLDGFTITAGNANGGDQCPGTACGGGMYNDHNSPVLTNLTFSSNSAQDGGGMSNYSSDPTLTNVTFVGNSATLAGGGVFSYSSNSILTNVTFNRNSADAGGGMYNYLDCNLILTNVTFTGNSAYGGGGMNNDLGSTSTLTNVIFIGNSATGDGGGLYSASSTSQIRNTIFWGNTAANSGAQIYNYGSYPRISDSVIQNGCPVNSGCTNIITGDPLLGTLGSYGGFTQTIPLLAGSPAIDTGNDGTCAATDQRGVTRPQGTHCDIGAYEYIDPNAPTSTSTLTATSTPILTATPTPTSTLTPTVTLTPVLVPSLFHPFVIYSSASAYGFSVEKGDFNGDGLLDAAMTTDTGLLLVYLQNNSGTFSIPPVSYQAGSHPYLLNAGDMNHDGRTDLIVTGLDNANLGYFGVFLQQTDGTLASMRTYSTSGFMGAVVVGDVSGDGLDDIVIADGNLARIGVFTQNISGDLNSVVTYYVSPKPVYDLAIGDINGDGRNDIIQTNLTDNIPSLIIYMQNNDGTLANTEFYFTELDNDLVLCVTIGDVTNDGRADVVIGYVNRSDRSGAKIAVIAQKNDGTWQSPVSYAAHDAPRAIKLADVNQDGLMDVVTANTDGVDPSSLGVYLGQSDGTLDVAQRFSLANRNYNIPRALTVGDLNNDTRPDLAVVDATGLAVFYGGNNVMVPQSPTPSITPTVTITKTPTITWTPTLTRTVTQAPTITQTPTPSATPVGTYYVKPTASGAGNCLGWGNACTLQTALVSAVGGDQIWVAAGTHKPTTGTVRTATFTLKSGVAVYGGFAGIETSRDQRDPTTNVTILSGDLNGDDQGFINNTENVYHVVTGATGATLDGFTITGGNAAKASPTDYAGAGIYDYKSSPILTNIIISGNSADYGGGMLNDTSNPILTNVTFSGNKAITGGGIYNENNSNSTMMNVTFMNNSASMDGGGIYNGSSDPKLTNVSFIGNSAEDGSGMYSNVSNPVLTNITFSNNSATRNGGGIYNEIGRPALTNVTFRNNSATLTGGGMYNGNSSPRIQDTIFWDNSASSGAQIYNSSSTPNINDSVLQDGCPTGSTCTNIIASDPRLGTLGSYGGFTQTIPLLAGSSAIDAGNDATCAVTDQRGVTRPQGAHCDIGAFEYIFLAATVTPTTTATVTVTNTTIPPTVIPGITPTVTVTQTNTPEPTFTPTEITPQTSTATVTQTETPEPSFTPTETATQTPIATITQTETSEPTFTPTVTATPGLPLAPVMAAPPNALATNDTTSTFNWNAVTNGNTYQLEISNTTSFAVKLRSFTGAPGILSYTATALPAGTYYWHVRALNINTVAGVWSEVRSFSIDLTPPPAPVLSSPANAASVIGTPAFAWLASTTAVKYQFQYDNNVNFASPTYTSAELAVLSLTPPTIAPGAYFWHARAKDAAGNWSPWSAARTVTIQPAVPLAPALTAPANALATNDTTPTFTWGAAVYGNTYQLEIAKIASFSVKLRSFTGAAGVRSYTSTALPAGVYYWHVRALNVKNAAGPWSAVRTFSIDLTPPAAPVLSAPANGAQVSGTPVFTWLAAASAVKYQFQYDNDAGFSSPNYTSAELAGLNFTPPAMTTGIYAWRVRARDAAGNWSAWSVARTIAVSMIPTATSTSIPATPTITPTATQTSTVVTPTITRTPTPTKTPFGCTDC